MNLRIEKQFPTFLLFQLIWFNVIFYHFEYSNKNTFLLLQKSMDLLQSTVTHY